MEIKRLGTTKLTVKFNTKHTNWDDTQTDFIGIEGEARSRCYSFKIQDAEGINFISENVKMLFKERGSSKVYFSKAIWNPEEEFYYCDIPGNILQKTQIIDIQVCIEDGTTRILTPVITKQVLSSLMSGAAASSGNDIYIDFKNLNDIQKIIDSEEERKRNELERIEDSKRIKEMLDTNLDSELKKYSKVGHNHFGKTYALNSGDGKHRYMKLATITRKSIYEDHAIEILLTSRADLPTRLILQLFQGFDRKPKIFTTNETNLYIYDNGKGIYEIYSDWGEIPYGTWNGFKVMSLMYSVYTASIEIYDTNFVDALPEGAVRAKKIEQNVFATKTELVSNVNLLNAKIDAKNKDCVTKTEYAKDRKRLNATIAREKKLETLAGLILEELRKQNPDLQPIDVANILKLEEDEE